MKGYSPLNNGTLFSEQELWLLRTFDPDHVPRRYGYLKQRIFRKLFGNNGAINIILNFVFSAKYENTTKSELEELLCQIDDLLGRLKA